MKTLQTLQDLRKMKHELEVRREIDRAYVESALNGFNLIYSSIRIAMNMIQNLRGKKEGTESPKKSLFDKIGNWAMQILQTFSMYR